MLAPDTRKHYFNYTTLTTLHLQNKLKDLATSLTKDKTNQEIEKTISNLIKQSSGSIEDNPHNWALVRKMIVPYTISPTNCIEIVSGVLETIDNTSRRDRLLELLPEDQRNIASAKVSPTMWQSVLEISELMYGNSSVDVPDRKVENRNISSKKSIRNK